MIESVKLPARAEQMAATVTRNSIHHGLLREAIAEAAESSATEWCCAMKRATRWRWLT
jgi:hypothetical protein